jgi:hypothetical protein
MIPLVYDRSESTSRHLDRSAADAQWNDLPSRYSATNQAPCPTAGSVGLLAFARAESRNAAYRALAALIHKIVPAAKHSTVSRTETGSTTATAAHNIIAIPVFTCCGA